jgi:type I restriction enzyme M protein
LDFAVNKDRIAKLGEEKFFQKASQEDQSKMLVSLENMKSDKVYKSLKLFEDAFFKAIDSKFFSGGFIKNVAMALSQRDENADIRIDKDGNLEPDNELRDYENVPYEMGIKKYFEKEVKPYVPDAWINESVTDHKDGKVGIVGYEIPFTRYFYKYEAPRSLETIETDIEKVENELLDLLKQL